MSQRMLLSLLGLLFQRFRLLQSFHLSASHCVGLTPGSSDFQFQHYPHLCSHTDDVAVDGDGLVAPHLLPLAAIPSTIYCQFSSNALCVGTSRLRCPSSSCIAPIRG